MIETEELDTLIKRNEDDLRILNGTWYMPNQNKNPKQEHVDSRIPGAVFFDVDDIADKKTDLPHNLPSVEEFIEHMKKLGVRRSDNIICYDNVGIFSSPRVAWTMQFFGAERVRILNGGFKKWVVENRRVESGEQKDKKAHVEGDYKYFIKEEKKVVRNFDDMNKIVQYNLLNSNDQVQIIDARSASRFKSEVDEPRKGVRRGNIKTSKNVFFNDLLDLKTGTIKSEAELEQIFKQSGVILQKTQSKDGKINFVSSCGSGMTACVVDLGLKLVGGENSAIYDGSWSEYGSFPEPEFKK